MVPRFDALHLYIWQPWEIIRTTLGLFGYVQKLLECLWYGLEVARGKEVLPDISPGRYVLPQRVWFLRRFGLETGIDFAHVCLESGMVFEGLRYIEVRYIEIPLRCSRATSSGTPPSPLAWDFLPRELNGIILTALDHSTPFNSRPRTKQGFIRTEFTL